MSSEHVEPWWWLSFADANRPTGQQFLGVAIMQATPSKRSSPNRTCED
jgi:hypothetical protein